MGGEQAPALPALTLASSCTQESPVLILPHSIALPITTLAGVIGIYRVPTMCQASLLAQYLNTPANPLRALPVGATIILPFHMRKLRHREFNISKVAQLVSPELGFMPSCLMPPPRFLTTVILPQVVERTRRWEAQRDTPVPAPHLPLQGLPLLVCPSMSGWVQALPFPFPPAARAGIRPGGIYSPSTIGG